MAIQLNGFNCNTITDLYPTSPTLITLPVYLLFVVILGNDVSCKIYSLTFVAHLLGTLVALRLAGYP